jgi:hypothetical protein
MPTGYTHDIPKGISFKTFALNCARHFGACITLRDEPGGGEHIPERFEPSDYNAKALEKARAEFERVSAMTDDECLLAHVAEWDEAEHHRLERLEKTLATREAYGAMLAQAKAWEPPSAGHAGLKAFMIQQIEESARFDCDTSYYDNPEPKLSGTEWRDKTVTRVLRDIAYHEREHAAEVERTNGRTAWVQALRAALPAD